MFEGVVEDTIDMKEVIENVRDEYYEKICKEVFTTLKMGQSYRQLFPHSRSIAPRPNPVRPAISLGSGTFNSDEADWEDQPKERTVTFNMDDADEEAEPKPTPDCSSVDAIRDYKDDVEWENQPKPIHDHSWRNRTVAFNLEEDEWEDSDKPKTTPDRLLRNVNGSLKSSKSFKMGRSS